MLGMTRYKAVVFILSLNPDRNHTVVDRAHGREELLPYGDRRGRGCTERQSFQIPVFSMGLWAQTM